jgi:SAM-dependent methyltransferase
VSAARSSPASELEAFERFEIAGWDACAEAYVRGFAHLTGALAEPLLDAAGVGNGSRVLDLGSGPGQVAGQAARRGAFARGVDAADSMVALARRRHPQLAFERADALALPFPDGSFDAVLANLLILHLGRPEAALGEAVRVLAPGGVFACTIYDLPSRARTVGVLLEAVAEVGPEPPSDVPTGPDMFQFAADGALEALLDQAGLGGRRVERIALHQQFASADALWTAMTDGTVRAAALLRAQPEDRLARMRAAFDARVEPYRLRDGRLVVPTGYLMGLGTKGEDEAARRDA